MLNGLKLQRIIDQGKEREYAADPIYIQKE